MNNEMAEINFVESNTAAAQVKETPRAPNVYTAALLMVLSVTAIIGFAATHTNDKLMVPNNTLQALPATPVVSDQSVFFTTSQVQYMKENPGTASLFRGSDSTSSSHYHAEIILKGDHSNNRKLQMGKAKAKAKGKGKSKKMKDSMKGTRAPIAPTTAKPTKAPTTAKPTKAPITAKPIAPTTAKPTKAPTTKAPTISPAPTRKSQKSMMMMSMSKMGMKM